MVLQHQSHRKYFGEVLPYLEVTKNQEDDEGTQIEMPNVTELTVKEAKKMLKELEIECEVDTDNTEAIVTNQLPKQGIQVRNSSKVILYTND